MEHELNRIPPEAAAFGLGCGNPPALADLKEGEVVLDLGSGGGVDLFLAANRVGSTGRVIGVDMTDEMLERARQTAQRHTYANVDFRINLSCDKLRVFKEAFRV